ncbi:MAG: 2-succinyl-5-enolpyruvyl-6-hydroxy-3-cyclohexene-1-carboxylic-acid synthase, partial [Caldilineae bacterium]
QSLTRLLPTDPVPFFRDLAARHTPAGAGAYRALWQELESRARQRVDDFLRQAPFGEFVAVREVLAALPPDTRLQLGNSMPVRYASFLGLPPAVARANANRGVSGIDGTLSTAVGAALATTAPTVLLTGDLAFFYDRNGLWHNHLPPNLRIVLLNNGGGGIFNLIDGPDRLPPAERERYFFTPHSLTARRTAADHDCAYFLVRTPTELRQCLPSFFAPSPKPAILEIQTDSERNAEVFREFKWVCFG